MSTSNPYIFFLLFFLFFFSFLIRRIGLRLRAISAARSRSARVDRRLEFHPHSSLYAGRKWGARFAHSATLGRLLREVILVPSPTCRHYVEPTLALIAPVGGSLNGGPVLASYVETYEIPVL